jgi:hypothetical protein
MDPLINFLETEGGWFFPLVLSLTFILANITVKGTLKILNLGTVGGDLTFSGCTILAGGLVKVVLAHKADAAITLGVGLVLSVGGIFWFILLSVGRSPSVFLRSVVGFLGGVILFACFYIYWYISR